MPPARTKPFYGWYIAVTLAVTETISWGIVYYAFTVFITPMEHELGWSRSELTGAFSLALLVMGCMAFPVGAWIDRHGPRLLMTLGSMAACLLVVAWSQVTSLGAFYLVWAGLGVCAATILYEPAFAVIAQWFHQQRGTALAVVTFAAGLASTIFLPLSDALLQQLGWRSAILILGLFLGCMTIPLHAFVLRRRPDDLGLGVDGLVMAANEKPLVLEGVSFRAALHHRLFWLVTLGFGLASLSAAAIRVHFIPFLIETGLPSSTAALATGSIGIMQVLGRVAFAPLDRRFSSRTIIVGVFALQAVALAVLLVGQSAALVTVFILLFGASQGALTLSRPSILCELYGVRHYGRISSIMALCLTLTSTAAPLAAGLLYDGLGSYQVVLWLVVGLALAATVVALFVRRDAVLLPALEAQ
jgi:MFS family permease